MTVRERTEFLVVIAGLVVCAWYTAHRARVWTAPLALPVVASPSSEAVSLPTVLMPTGAEGESTTRITLANGASVNAWSDDTSDATWTTVTCLSSIDSTVSATMAITAITETQ